MFQTRCWLLLVLAGHVMIETQSVKMPSIALSNVSCKSLDENFLTFPTCKLTKIKGDRNALDMHIHYQKVQVFTSVTLRLKLFRQTSSGFTPFMYNNIVEFCEFYENSKVHMFWNSFYRILAQYSNVNHSCPYDHDLYVKDMVIDGKDLTYAPMPRGKYMFQIYMGWSGIEKAKFMIYINKN